MTRRFFASTANAPSSSSSTPPLAPINTSITDEKKTPLLAADYSSNAQKSNTPPLSPKWHPILHSVNYTVLSTCEFILLVLKDEIFFWDENEEVLGGLLQLMRKTWACLVAAHWYLWSQIYFDRLLGYNETTIVGSLLFFIATLIVAVVVIARLEAYSFLEPHTVSESKRRRRRMFTYTTRLLLGWCFYDVVNGIMNAVGDAVKSNDDDELPGNVSIQRLIIKLVFTIVVTALFTFSTYRELLAERTKSIFEINKVRDSRAQSSFSQEQQRKGSLPGVGMTGVASTAYYSPPSPPMLGVPASFASSQAGIDGIHHAPSINIATSSTSDMLMVRSSVNEDTSIDV